MDDYLSKPVSVEKLKNALERWRPATGDRRDAASSQNISVKRSSSPVDMNRLREAASDDEELMRELIEIYLRQMSENREKLKAAVEADAPDAVKSLAHAMLGGSATCGMIAVAGLLRELEQADYGSRRLNGAMPFNY